MYDYSAQILNAAALEIINSKQSSSSDLDYRIAGIFRVGGGEG